MSNDKPIFIRQEILQQAIDDLEEKKAELLELQDKVSYMENYLIIFHNMSVGNSLVLEDIANIKIDTTGIKAAIEVVKADVIAVESQIATLTAGQGVLQTDVSNLTTSLTSVNTQVQLLNTGDMTILGQKTFDGTTIFNGEVDMTSTSNKTIGNTGGGITRIDGNATIGTLGSPTDLSGIVTINTGFTNNNTTIGSASGAGQLTIDSTTNLNGAVNATSTNNKTIGNTSGGITQINGTTQINSAVIGNTTIGNAGGGTTTLNGTTTLSGTNNIGVLNGTNNLAGNVNINTANPNNNTTIGNVSGGGQLFVNGGANFSGTTNLNNVGNFTRNLLSVKRWGISGPGGNSDYGSAGNRIGSTLFRTSGTTSFSSVTASGGAIASAWDNPNGFFTFPETGTYIINVILFTNGGKIQSGVGAYAGGGGSFIDGTGFMYLFNDNTATNPPNTTTINTATFLYCASGTGNTFYIGSAGTGSCLIYTGVAHSSFIITKVG